MNNSSEAIQDECLVYILHPLGGKLKNPSLGAQVVFVVNIIINVRQRLHFSLHRLLERVGDVRREN